MATLGNEGFGADRVELWVIGLTGQESAVADFAGTASESCFASDQVWNAYRASKDDLWLIQPDGQGVLWGNLNDFPLDAPANAAALEGAIRGML